jgi:hypothetical protein
MIANTLNLGRVNVAHIVQKTLVDNGWNDAIQAQETTCGEGGHLQACQEFGSVHG